MLAQRVHHFEIAELQEIGVGRVDAAKAVLAHEDGRAHVEEEVAARVGQSRQRRGEGAPVAVGGLQDVNVFGFEERLQKTQTIAPPQRMGKDLRMGRDAQELVENAVGQVPGVGGAADAGEECMGGGVLVRVGVRAVQQKIRVDQTGQVTNP